MYLQEEEKTVRFNVLDEDIPWLLAYFEKMK